MWTNSANALNCCLLLSLLLAACGDDSTASVSGSGGDGQGELERTWPGRYYSGGDPSALQAYPEIRVFEFFDDGTVSRYNHRCDSTRSTELRYRWVVTDRNTIEVLLVEGDDAGEVLETVSPGPTECGPHQFTNRSGSERPFVPGNYCPVILSTDVTGRTLCDMEPCNELAQRCAEAAENE